MNAELFKQRERHKLQHQIEWAQWVKDEKIEILETKGMGGFKVGDKVTYTNEYGVKFEGHTVMGFEQPDKYGNCVYLDLDCFWMAQKLSEISKSP